MTSGASTDGWHARGTPLGAMVAAWAGVLDVVLAMIPPYVLTREADQPSWTDAADAIVRSASASPSRRRRRSRRGRDRASWGEP